MNCTWCDAEDAVEETGPKGLAWAFCADKDCKKLAKEELRKMQSGVPRRNKNRSKMARASRKKNRRRR